jgi:hypothetical protein
MDLIELGIKLFNLKLNHNFIYEIYNLDDSNIVIAISYKYKCKLYCKIYTINLDIWEKE